MKNLFLTGAFALLSFAASAQFMIVADIDTEEFDTENITETTDLDLVIHSMTPGQ